jgi:hypothetical protein
MQKVKKSLNIRPEKTLHLAEIPISIIKIIPALPSNYFTIYIIVHFMQIRTTAICSFFIPNTRGLRFFIKLILSVLWWFNGANGWHH